MIADHKRSVFIESKTVSISLVTLMYRHRVPRGGSDEKKDREGERDWKRNERLRLISLEERSSSLRVISSRFIYIYIHAVWDSAFARNKSGRGEEREGEEKIRGGGGDRGRLAS